jgi:hypothetical protein
MILTLLNADLQVMARIIVNSLDQWLPSIIHTSQHCGIRGHTIFDAVATIREVIAQAEHKQQALCILSLDLQAAFDNISHQYLYKILDRYGFSAKSQKRIRSPYDNAMASIHINGNTSNPVPIRCGVR